MSRRVDYNSGGVVQQEAEATPFTDYPIFIRANFNSSQFLRELSRPDSHLATVFQQWMYAGGGDSNTAVITASDSDS